ncbi:uncharacterized protein LOC121972260 [Zingiber officinale]|uniref:uncharacterized protein LOC121972260 n=1 Tax=Zingiber officinale TaxID=94328 RepID=UPI001C4C3A85|nr:uncharacterized protein LOC121972260 [Zingiber officinale]
MTLSNRKQTVCADIRLAICLVEGRLRCYGDCIYMANGNPLAAAASSSPCALVPRAKNLRRLASRIGILSSSPLSLPIFAAPVFLVLAPRRRDAGSALWFRRSCPCLCAVIPPKLGRSSRPSPSRRWICAVVPPKLSLPLRCCSAEIRQILAPLAISLRHCSRCQPHATKPLSETCKTSTDNLW